MNLFAGTPTVLDSNGQKYLAGWDKHGYFTIQMVELLDVESAINAKGEETIEYEGTDYIPKPVGEYPNTSVPADAADEVARLIQEGP